MRFAFIRLAGMVDPDFPTGGVAVQHGGDPATHNTFLSEGGALAVAVASGAIEASVIGEGEGSGGSDGGPGENSPRSGFEGAGSPALRVAAPASNDQPLNPAPGSAGLHEQVQPVAVGVSSRRGGTQEGSRQGLVGMAALGFGFSRSAGGIVYSMQSPI